VGRLSAPITSRTASRGRISSIDLAVLEQVGNQLAIALENARLYTQAAQRVDVERLMHPPGRQHPTSRGYANYPAEHPTPACRGAQRTPCPEFGWKWHPALPSPHPPLANSSASAPRARGPSHATLINRISCCSHYPGPIQRFRAIGTFITGSFFAHRSGHCLLFVGLAPRGTRLIVAALAGHQFTLALGRGHSCDPLTRAGIRLLAPCLWFFCGLLLVRGRWQRRACR